MIVFAINFENMLTCGIMYKENISIGFKYYFNWYSSIHSKSSSQLLDRTNSSIFATLI